MKSQFSSLPSALSSRLGRKKSKQSHEERMDDRTFHMFGMLNDDIVPIILSFVAEAPYENGDSIDGRCNMTHVLPLVNKAFYQHSKLLWKPLLHRVLHKEPFLWETPLYHLIQKAKHLNTHNPPPDQKKSKTDEYPSVPKKNCPSKHTSISNRGQKQTKEQEKQRNITETVDQALKALTEINHHYENKNQTSTEESKNAVSLSSPPAQLAWMDYQALFQHVIQTHIQYRSSLFHMPCDLSIGRTIDLHFFEPRYRLLISEVMSPFPVSFRRGETIVPTVPTEPSIPKYRSFHTTSDKKLSTRTSWYKYKVFPNFLFANHVPLTVGAPACIVEVRECIIYTDGTADVRLMPIAHVWVQSLHRRRGAGNLWEATTLRMGSQSTRKHEQHKEQQHWQFTRQL